MKLLALLGIVLANNLDNTGVGLALGIARVRLSLLANTWVATVTFLVTGAATLLGEHTTRLLSAPLAHLISAAILCGMGAWILATARPAGEAGDGEGSRSGSSSMWKRIGRPSTYDRDGSHHIDFGEASLLALLLSINNVGGGVSAGLVGLSPFEVGLGSALVSFAVLGLGTWAGDRAAIRYLGARAPFLSGSLLVLVGLLQLR